MIYRLELHTGIVDRTTWWKNEDRREPANVWRTHGPGCGADGRPSTDVEIELWKAIEELRASQSQPEPKPQGRRKQSVRTA